MLDRSSGSLHKLISKNRLTKELISFANSENKEFRVKTLAGSLKSALVAAFTESTEHPAVVIAPDEAIAEEWLHDLSLFADTERLSMLAKPPRSIHISLEEQEEDYSWLIEGLVSLLKNKAPVAVITGNLLSWKVPEPEQIISSAETLAKGQKLVFEEFTRKMGLSGFERKDYVAEQGDMAVRGGIVDIYPIGWANPLRIEFWDDEIESIREFNCLSQRSIKEYDDVEFIGKLFHSSNTERIATIFDYLPPNAIFILDSPETIAADEDYSEYLSAFKRIYLNHFGPADLTVESLPQPEFSGSAKNVCEKLKELGEYQYKLFICADGKVHIERLREIIDNALAFENIDAEESRSPAHLKLLDSITWLGETPSKGFILPNERIACLTEHQIFSRMRARDIGKRKSKSGITLRELQELNIGDLVVHADKGIGKFNGFQTVELGGSMQDCAKIQYAEGDILYVHLNYINKLQKYSAQEGVVPKLTKLGSAEWSRKKAKTKKRLKDIARELIKLYAERKNQPGFAYSADSVWQKEFEASFIYEDTHDQASTTDDVKRDMEAEAPMDRLVCGDVGFGKTEIAIRAAFKAAQDGKQTAVLVPTTILAQQHFMTFRDRLHRYPVNLEVISRFRTAQEQKDILNKLKTGAIDILIGTHRILSKDINFKELGLLIIDEEHRFGVGAKEKLRQMRVSVDTLTLTATPIPRTLNFSLMGARDLSVIETPPRNRLPVYTEIMEWKNETIIAALDRELKRGGQAFFVNDNIFELEKLAGNLKMLMPNLRVGIAHGQLPPKQIEGIMEKFIQRKIDVLVTTKIVESGLDIPNANTIFINKSHHFGLAELYQLRGRVGRTNIQAYCYLLVPPFRKLQSKALRRLQALEEFTELGSGFQLAMRDMEIRGAGNLLGAEQSGFIEDIGFDLYHRILDEAVEEIKREEFAEIFKDTQKPAIDMFANEDISIELDSDAFLPPDFVKNDTDRFTLYKRLYKVKTNNELQQIVEEITDRFGKLPKQAQELIFAVKVRISALPAGFTRVIVKKNQMLAEFPPSENKEYYEKAFPVISEYLPSLYGARLFQQKSKLMLEAKLEQRENALEIFWKIKKTLEFVE